MDWFWHSLWIIVQVFVFFAYLLVLFHIVTDLFRDRKLGGFGKAIWVFFLVLIPWLTALVYLIARGKGMGERQLAQAQAAQDSANAYIRDVAGTSPAQQIETAKALLDSGAISPDEFAKLKAAALAKA